MSAEGYLRQFRSNRVGAWQERLRDDKRRSEDQLVMKRFEAQAQAQAQTKLNQDGHATMDSRPKVANPSLAPSGPYDPVQLLINSHPIEGRPIAWSGEVSTHDLEPVQVTRVVTTCPGCGAGLELDVGDGQREFRCPHCQGDER